MQASKMSDRRIEERDEMSAGQHSVFLWVFLHRGSSFVPLRHASGGFFALATCFTAGSHINTALAPKQGTLYTATVNAKDTANKGASASNIKGGTQGNAVYFSDILIPFTKKMYWGERITFATCKMVWKRDIKQARFDTSDFYLLFFCYFLAQHGWKPAPE